MLKESLESFIPPVYVRIKRSPATYKSLAARCKLKLEELIKEYNEVKNDQQLLREIRNDMDNYLRRYHDYCIKEKIGAHYIEVGADKTDFEHLIPLARVRDMMYKGHITVEQALNIPTVKLSKEKHRLLKETGWGDKTPDMWLPFTRYSNVFTATYQTHDGTEINPLTWTLEDHYNYFKHLVI
jgi:hypothetical protein